jgi:hypothetical protein
MSTVRVNYLYTQSEFIRPQKLRIETSFAMITQLVILFFGILVGNAIGPFFTGRWNVFWEQERLLCALKVKIKRLLFRRSNAGPQSIENLADECDELAQSIIYGLKRRRKRKKGDDVSNADLLEAADILRQAAKAGTGLEDRAKQRELIALLRVRLSPHEEQELQQ